MASMRVQSRSVRLLAIEDDRDQRILLAHAFRDIGYREFGDNGSVSNFVQHSIDSKRFMMAENGVQGCKLFRMYTPSIVLLDINLPDMSGVKILETMKKVKEDCHVIMVTGDHYRETVQECVKCGADGYIAKPFSPKALCSYIEMVVGEPL